MRDTSCRRPPLPRPAPLLVAAALALLPGVAGAQIPDEFTNLKLLPKDISKEELVGTMRGWSRALDVRCSHCHVGPDNLEGMDFASDEREAKRETREMIVLTRAINDDYLHPEEGHEVTCHTCHHGLTTPPRDVAEELTRAAERRGIEGAVARFRELHEYYYATGRYDLSPGGLVDVAGALFDTYGEDVLQLLALGLELYPDSGAIHAGYGRLYLALERPEQARQSFEKALELDPRNRTARRGLRALERAAQER